MATIAADVAQQPGEADARSEQNGKEQLLGEGRDDGHAVRELQHGGGGVATAGGVTEGSGGGHHTGDHRRHPVGIDPGAVTQMTHQQTVHSDEQYMLHAVVLSNAPKGFVELCHRVVVKGTEADVRERAQARDCVSNASSPGGSVP